MVRLPVAPFLLLTAVLFLPFPAFARADARLLTVDAAETIDHPVIGLQRTAVPIVAGFAIDTSLIGDIALAPNLGVRWAMSFGQHTVVVGARYAQFVGADVYSSLINSSVPQVKRFAPTFSGPSFYALYGYDLGAVLLQVEARYSLYQYSDLSLTGSASLKLSDAWSIVGELGGRILGVPPVRASLGVRFTGDHFGFTLGATYVGIDDPLLPAIPVLPALDLSWSFS